MPIDIRKYLTHSAQLRKFQGNAFGDTEITSIYTISCFSYYGNNDRSHSSRQFTQRPGWTVIIPSSLTSLVCVGDGIGSLVNERGDTLINSVGFRVDEITRYNHHIYGTQFVQLQLAQQ